MEKMKAFDSPLVSAIVPAYNAEAFVEQTVRSLLDQTYESLEIIVVDDGSTDKTADRVDALTHKHPQIRLIRQSNRGVAAARNRGIEESRGEFIAPVDADDIWFPDAVKKLADCLLKSDLDVGVAYAWSVIIDENGMLDGRFRCSKIEGNVLATLICHNFLGNASSTLIRRACFDQVGGYDEAFYTRGFRGFEDWDLYLRIARYYRFRVVPQFLIGYRKSATSMTSDLSSMADSYEEFLKVARHRHSRFPPALYRLSRSSFYLYLAHECYYRAQPSDSFRWLRKALMKAPLFTLMRPALHLLTARSFGAILGSSIRHKRPIRSGKNTTIQASKGMIKVQDVERKYLHIFLKNLGQSALDRMVSWLWNLGIR
jgi:glycosyltransferase involved in cell wall biosynthesis